MGCEAVNALVALVPERARATRYSSRNSLRLWVYVLAAEHHRLRDRDRAELEVGAALRADRRETGAGRQLILIDAWRWCSGGVPKRRWCARARRRQRSAPQLDIAHATRSSAARRQRSAGDDRRLIVRRRIDSGGRSSASSRPAAPPPRSCARRAEFVDIQASRAPALCAGRRSGHARRFAGLEEGGSVAGHGERGRNCETSPALETNAAALLPSARARMEGARRCQLKFNLDEWRRPTGARAARRTRKGSKAGVRDGRDVEGRNSSVNWLRRRRVEMNHLLARRATQRQIACRSAQAQAQEAGICCATTSSASNRSQLFK